MIRCAAYVVSVPLLLSLAACMGQSKSSLKYGDKARQQYEEAMVDFEDNDCLTAEPAFRAVRREFPYSRYAPLAELRVADCMLEERKFAEAIEAFRRFTRLRPSHDEVPYARFMIAKAHFEQIPDDWLLAPPAHERDQTATKEAVRQVRSFIEDFPEDERREKAQEMLRASLALLARHELYVAEFYLDRGNPLAAIARLRTLLETYAGSGVEPRALLIMGRTYLELRDEAMARQSFTQLLTEYPDSSLVKQAKSYLAALVRT